MATEIISERKAYDTAHPLQSLDVYQSLRDDAGWIIFIHGGAWRDPKINSSAGKPLISRLLLTLSCNAASLDYRLSHYPQKTESNTDTPEFPSESAPTSSNINSTFSNSDLIHTPETTFTDSEASSSDSELASSDSEAAYSDSELGFSDSELASPTLKLNSSKQKVTTSSIDTTPAKLDVININLEPTYTNPEVDTVHAEIAPEEEPIPPNTARHPDHINDVLNALEYLHKNYTVPKYVLIGHSAGATLACQVVEAILAGRDLPLPKAVVGVEGIYDIPELVKEYSAVPIYREFVEGAFGNEEEWPPALDVEGYKGLVVLAHSDQDSLLTWRQTEAMKDRLEKKLGTGGTVRVLKAKGEHDEVLTTTHLADVVGRYVGELI